MISTNSWIATGGPQNRMQRELLDMFPAVFAVTKTLFETEMANHEAAICHGTEMEDKIEHMSCRLRDM